MCENEVKTLIVGPLPPPVGGVSSSVINLTKVFEFSNEKYRLFSTSSGSLREDLYKTKNFSQYLRALTLLKDFFIYLKKSQNLSICHIFVVSNSAFLRDLVLLVMLKFFGLKIHIHFHSKTSGEIFLSRMLLPILGRALSLGERVFVLSEAHKFFFEKHIQPNKIRVLENYVDSINFESLSQKNSSWLYVGRLSELKGFFDLINAVDIAVNKHGMTALKIHCLGLADTESNQALIECFIKNKKLENNILLHGLVTGDSKFEFFKTSKGLIFPSKFENSPVVLKEAICSNMAIIASDIEANKNILDRVGNAKYFSVDSVDSLANILIYLENAPSEVCFLQSKANLSLKYDLSYARNIVFD